MKFDTAASGLPSPAVLEFRRSGVIAVACPLITHWEFQIVARLKSYASDELTLEGQPITGPPGEVSVVFQNRALFPWIAVQGNVAFDPGNA